MSGDEPFEIAVVFTVPAESEQHGFPTLRGEGSVRECAGGLVVHGRVFRLSAWWMKVGALLGFLAMSPLYALFDEPGLFVGLGAVLAVVLADFWQQTVGRAYELEIPAGCAFRTERRRERRVVQVQLDQFLVGGGRRPPLVEMEMDAVHAEQVHRLLSGPLRREWSSGSS